ncbi:MAG: hypothetical protein Hals2KO_14940 [Halioglobus sp.]
MLCTIDRVLLEQEGDGTLLNPVIEDLVDNFAYRDEIPVLISNLGAKGYKKYDAENEAAR